jgi:hypothetical protein
LPQDSSSRAFDEVGEQPSDIASRGLYLVIFPKHAAILHSRTSLAITAVIAKGTFGHTEMAILLEVGN